MFWTLGRWPYRGLFWQVSPELPSQEMLLNKSPQVAAVQSQARLLTLPECPKCVPRTTFWTLWPYRGQFWQKSWEPPRRNCEEMPKRVPPGGRCPNPRLLRLSKIRPSDYVLDTWAMAMGSFLARNMSTWPNKGPQLAAVQRQGNTLSVCPKCVPRTTFWTLWPYRGQFWQKTQELPGRICEEMPPGGSCPKPRLLRAKMCPLDNVLVITASGLAIYYSLCICPLVAKFSVREEYLNTCSFTRMESERRLSSVQAPRI